MRFLISAFLLSSALIAAAPAAAQTNRGPVDPSITDGSARAKLDDARAEWGKAGFRDYAFTVRQICFCPSIYTMPQRIHVKAGKPRRGVRSNLTGVATVPRLFRRVQGAIDSKVAVLGVRYGAHGVPESISINPSLNIVDEEVGYGVRAFMGS